MGELGTIIMELLVNVDATRGQALTALQLTRKDDFAGAKQVMTESREYVKQTHRIQTQPIDIDEDTGKLPINLVTVRSQDHLMNAMVVQDLTGDMIELCRRLPPIN